MGSDPMSSSNVSPRLGTGHVQPDHPIPLGRLAGSLLWLIAGLAFYLAGQNIPRESFAGKSDPGPALVPMLGAMILFVGGLLDAGRVLIGYTFARRTKARLDSPSPGGHSPSSPCRRSRAIRAGRALLPALAVLLFGLTLPWVGFAISCWCFVASWLVVCRASWWQIVIVPTLLDATVLLLFGQLFEVQLPRGVWGFP